MKSSLSLFLTAAAQVLFVTLSTYMIANDRVVPMVLSGFMISLIWTFNVKRIAFSDLKDRLIYASGATFGTLIGYYIGKIITSI
jgi:hypothetical protein